MTTWIVVAHRAGARFFELQAPGQGLSLVREEDHPEGRLKAGDIDTDKPGGVRDTGGGGQRAMSKKEHADEHVAHVFARQIAGILKHERAENRYKGVVLVAEPGFLGMLREALDAPTAKCVHKTIAKDLAHVSARDLGNHLKDAVAI